DNNTIKIEKGAYVTIIGDGSRLASVISTSSSGGAIRLNGAASLHVEGLDIVAAGDASSGVGPAAVVIGGTYGQVDAFFNLNGSQISAANIRGLSVSSADISASNFSITTGLNEDNTISSKNHL